MSRVIAEMNVRAVRDVEGAFDLLRLLGYDGDKPRAADAGEFGLAGTAQWIRSSPKKREGYGVLVAEVDKIPASLRTFGRLLASNLHDAPLAILGQRDGHQWGEFVVVRPRLVRGGAGAVSVAKLRVDPQAPTRHDVEVLRGLAWEAGRGDAGNRRAVDQALDVEQVTRRFFKGLNAHYEKLVASLRALAQQHSAVHAAVSRVDPAEGPERVGLRILTQTLFCYFVQRKGLLKGDPRWLSKAYNAAAKQNRQFYPEVMERLFYEWLNTPEEQRGDQADATGIPFLNGGLFERRYGNVSLPLPNDLFSTSDGLLGFLDHWSFTVSEDTADEADVSVDPEMLGKVFENLMAEDKKKKEGTVYTPRPVVQFMCREALVPWLQRQADIDEPTARLLVTDDDPFSIITERGEAGEATRVAQSATAALDAIQVLDPAVGSGAFLLGMLSETLRLRRLAHVALMGTEPDPQVVDKWKLHAIEHNLFGVDINPTAIELCRLRLWLSLLVDAPAAAVRPLPNLEYRTVCADSLSDYLGGVEVSRSTRRWHEPPAGRGLEIDLPDSASLLATRERYFEASDPAEKVRLRAELAALEDDVVAGIFSRTRKEAEGRFAAAREETRRAAKEVLVGLAPLESEFESRDRVYPLFVPAFHAPEAVARGGWDVVIMNPPYVGRKAVAERLSALKVEDLKTHYGRTYDLMLHFGFRATEFARDGGVVSMIFNDSIFTSTDAEDFRQLLASSNGRKCALHVASRTRCFEGVGIVGGVIIASVHAGEDPEVRWVENYKKPVGDLLAASRPLKHRLGYEQVGQSALFEVEADAYQALPHRPLFRPSPPAVELLSVYKRCAEWTELSRLECSPTAEARGEGDWSMLSETKRLNRWITARRDRGFFDVLAESGEFVLLGLIVEGGQGLATADDRRFLAAIEGTEEAARARETQARLEELVLGDVDARPYYEQALARSGDRAAALLETALKFDERSLGWPKVGTIRIASADRVHVGPLTGEEIKGGVAGSRVFVPFEKGDATGEEGGASAWSRTNPIVIDWSTESVALLRERAQQKAARRKPRLQTEHMWGASGITWNAVSRYLRVRLVPEGSIFGHGAPVIRPTVDWLTSYGLLALLNAPVLDFALRTFLTSVMNTHVGDLRRLPMPVLDAEASDEFDQLGRSAVEAKDAGDFERLADIEAVVDKRVRVIYGIRADEELWVVR